MSIPFTQYLRPYGRKVAVSIEMEPEVEAKAQQIIDAGFVFEIEQLSTGQVSATIADPRTDEDVKYASIVPNGPRVPEAIKLMILEFQIPTNGESND